MGTDNLLVERGGFILGHWDQAETHVALLMVERNHTIRSSSSLVESVEWMRICDLKSFGIF
jgi:hypothetical protein